MRARVAVVLLAAGCLVPTHERVGSACELEAHPCPVGMFCVSVTDGGVGRVCSLTDEVPVPPPRVPTTFYVRPDGNDDDDGGASAPWKTWTNALGRLEAGDTLMVMDGVWADTTSTTCPSSLRPCLTKQKLPDIDCTSTGSQCDGNPCVSGTPALPITVRAQHERQALLKSDGQLPALRIAGCANWIIEGLRVEMTDRQQATSNNSVVSVTGVQGVQLKKLLINNPNGWLTSYGLSLSGSRDVLIEDNELYWFHRNGFAVTNSSNVVLRRCYANSRLRGTLYDGGGGTYRDRGDDAFSLSNVSDSVVENCISENNSGYIATRSGCLLDAGSCANVQVLGSISLSDLVFAFRTYSYAETRESTSYSDTFADDVAIGTIAGTGSGGDAFTLYAAVEGRVRNVSSFGAGHDGFIFVDMLNGGSGTYCSGLEDAGLMCSASVSNSLFMSSFSRGFYQTVGTLSFDAINSFASASSDLSRPDASVVTNVTRVDPVNMGDGGCFVYVPASSPLHGAASDGGDIGANLVYRYENGVLTTQKLWSDLGFPCGAVAAGLNDGASSCRNVHQRLNVGTPACPVP